MDLKILEKLSDLIKENKKTSQRIIEDNKINFYREYIHINNINNTKSNKLYKGDNLLAMIDLLNKGYNDKIDLIYIDPPFYTMSNYTNKIEILNGDKKEVIEYLSFSDIWKEGLLEYLKMIILRIFLMKELLSEKGTVYIHLDFRTVHYVKTIMDAIFGEDNFLNEIIWSYKSGGTSNRYFSRKHDNILVYTKTKNYIFNPQKEKSYNRDFKAYKFNNVEEYQDNLGWYTLVNARDVWDISMVGRTSKERVGYSTQKPETLLERIILSSSNEDSIVGDFFAGSGTTPVVAERNNRQWISSDISNMSIMSIKKRLYNIKNSPYTIYSKENEYLKSNLEFDYVEYKGTTDNKRKLKIKLNKYMGRLDNLRANKKDFNKINEITKKNSLSLIDYIGIGYKYSKDESIIFFEIYRSKDSLLVPDEFIVPIPNFNTEGLFIKIVDIFGQESLNLL